MGFLSHYRRPRTLGEAADRDLLVEVVFAAAGVTLFLLYTVLLFLPAWRNIAPHLAP
jgi:hypothetical protein